MDEIYGLIRFPISITCSKEVLGKSFRVTIEGINGFLDFPSKPDWVDDDPDPLSKQLLPPNNAPPLKREEVFYWGTPLAHPTGKCAVHRALFRFPTDNTERIPGFGETVFHGILKWIDVFQDFSTIVFRRSLAADSVMAYGNNLECFRFGESGKYIPEPSIPSTSFTIVVSDKEKSLKPEQIELICDLCSSGKKPVLEYLMLIGAYDALARHDSRKTIIEAATAAEISLTKRIKHEFADRDIEFGEKLLNKYRTLGNRFALADMLNIDLPVSKKEYDDDFVGLRNKIVHEGYIPERREANNVINITNDLLSVCSPEIAETPVGKQPNRLRAEGR